MATNCSPAPTGIGRRGKGRGESENWELRERRPYNELRRYDTVNNNTGDIADMRSN